MSRQRWAYLFAAVLLLGAGVAWLNLLNVRVRLLTPAPIIGALIGIGLACLPGPGTSVRKTIRWLSDLSPPARVKAAAVVGVFSIGMLITIQLLQQRPWEMVWHDEFQFHVQSQLLARFRLWMPPHELADFFDTFYVLMRPVYAPQSFPGAALLFVPTVWLTLPTWVMPMLVTGIACALMWWVLSELSDPASASAAMLVLLCSFGFQRVSTMYTAQMPVLMLGLVGVVALFRWRLAGQARWLWIMGGAMGWAAITRPLDAACYGAIIAIGMIPKLIRLQLKKIATTAIIVVLAASPFLCLQLVFNIGVTGSITRTPFSLYNQQDQPALGYGAPGDLSQRPATKIPQKQWFYDEFALKFIRYHNDPNLTWHELWANRTNEMLRMVMPAVSFLPLLCVGLLGLGTGRRALLFLLLPLFVLSYHFYPIFVFHYVLFAIPAIALLYALIPHALVMITGANYARMARAAAVLGLSGMAIASQIDQARYEVRDVFKKERLSIDRSLSVIQPPAIVLFTPPTEFNSVHLEVVYNDDVAWPDDAPIIRAHDRGDQNIALYRYYARVDPQREVWRFDRPSMTLHRLGNVHDLAKAQNP